MNPQAVNIMFSHSLYCHVELFTRHCKICKPGN